MLNLAERIKITVGAALIAAGMVLLSYHAALSGQKAGEGKEGLESELPHPPWLLHSWSNNSFDSDPKIAADEEGNVHIVFVHYKANLSEGERPTKDTEFVPSLQYLKIFRNGTILGPINVSEESTHIWHADVEADSLGRANIVWTTDVPGGHSEVAFARVGVDGRILVPQTLISDDDVRSIRPALAVDKDDNVHVVFTDSHGLTPTGAFNWELHYTKIDAGGRIVVKNRPWGDYHIQSEGFGDIAADSRGILHVVYIHFTPTFLNTEIHYRRFTNDGVPISTNKRLTHIRSNGNFPKIAMDGDDNIHIAWYDDALSEDMGYGVWYMRLGPGGVMRQRPVEVTNETPVAHIFYMYTVGVEVTKAGDVILKWFSSGGSFYNVWNPNKMVRKDGIRYADSVTSEISLDGKDRLHAAYLKGLEYNGIVWPQVAYSRLNY